MNKYEVLGVVGEGAYGIVLKCRNRENGESVAIKKFKESDDDEENVRKTTLREVKILRMLRHPNIVSLKEAFRRKGKLYLVFEFVAKNLLEVLETNPSGVGPDGMQRAAAPANRGNRRECRRRIERNETCSSARPNHKRRRYMLQLCQAIECCHAQSVVHRDIKPENLLINTREKQLKLCDFGFARTFSPNCELSDYVATRWYRAPELLLGSTRYNMMVDIFACGCIMGELADGQPLFPGESEIDQLYIIQRMLGPLTRDQHELFLRNPRFVGLKFPDMSRPETLQKKYVGKLSKRSLHFLKGLLQMEPSNRQTAKECLEHGYFEDIRQEYAQRHELQRHDHPLGSAAARAPSAKRQGSAARNDAPASRAAHAPPGGHDQQHGADWGAGAIPAIQPRVNAPRLALPQADGPGLGALSGGGFSNGFPQPEARADEALQGRAPNPPSLLPPERLGRTFNKHSSRHNVSGAAPPHVAEAPAFRGGSEAKGEEGREKRPSRDRGDKPGAAEDKPAPRLAAPDARRPAKQKRNRDKAARPARAGADEHKAAPKRASNGTVEAKGALYGPGASRTSREAPLSPPYGAAEEKDDAPARLKGPRRHGAAPPAQSTSRAAHERHLDPMAASGGSAVLGADDSDDAGEDKSPLHGARPLRDDHDGLLPRAVGGASAAPPLAQAKRGARKPRAGADDGRAPSFPAPSARGDAQASARERERDVQRDRERRRETEIRELRDFSSKLPLKMQQKLADDGDGFYHEPSGAAPFDACAPRAEARSSHGPARQEPPRPGLEQEREWLDAQLEREWLEAQIDAPGSRLGARPVLETVQHQGVQHQHLQHSQHSQHQGVETDFASNFR